ncbi:non-ribosomal peptide synthetase [Xanthomonas oryzae]|uniref:non-ribosomal peptide synthetase n=1 Tax=Xanthomonas oryzae TaxID=347 RepID=UPI0023EA7817|nr:non-ribosomal peptide synthetase [Xanthomonas oryzae]
MECIDLRHATDAHAQAQHDSELEAQTAFDLTRGPLIRGRLLRLADEEHRLLVTMHHIVSDGWSMGLLVNELSTLYAAFAQGQPDPLPPLPIQYADYTLWQRRWLQGPVLQRQLDFWREHLHGAPALLELPTDRPRPPLQDYSGESVEFALDAELTSTLVALSQRHGTTVFMTVLAAWGVLLARLSGQDQAVIGTPVANRTRSELEPLIGFFVNTQALRVDLRERPSVAALLAQVRATALTAQDHQDLPFEHLIEALNPERSLSHHPVFQAMLTWQNNAAGALRLPGIRLQPIPTDRHDAKFDLELFMGQSEDRILGRLAYATALFDRSTIERQLAQFVQVLAAMAAEDRAAVHRLPLLPVEQRAQLQGFTSTDAAPIPARCIHHLFEDQVRRTPDAIALLEGEVQLSYAVLEARANHLAHRLHASGVGLESRVALYLPRGIDQVVALLATLKAGAAYLPLDPELPSERLTFLLEDSRPRAVLTCEALQDTLQASCAMLHVRVLTLDLDANLDRRDPGPPSVQDLCPDHLAYIIYTSGSTGQPKGTLLTHAGAAHYLQWAVHTYRPFPSAVVSSSLAFDATLTSLLAPLLCGARVELLPEYDTLDALRQRLCDATPLGLVKLTPAHLEVLGQQLADHPQPLSAKVMVIGGEALSSATLARWQTLAPHTRLINEYGPTETVVGCVVHEATAEDAHTAHGRVPIGRPIDQLRLYVLDPHGQLAPIGVAGHLHIAGPQLARGYLARPDLTADRFVPDPFAEQPGQRMYRSGDLACWRADGTLDYLGRNDDQVKLRGHRIELGDIAAALRACNGVQDAAVLLREDTPGERRLVAYLVGGAEHLAAEALRAQLATRLPEVMLPTAYVPLDALPLTPNGKLDRKAFPSPDASAYATNAHETPQGPVEEAIAAIWRDLLGLETIGRRDDFFALGGHSLLAVRVASRLRQDLGAEIGLADLFAHTTLEQLAACVASSSAAVLPPITPLASDAPPLLSFAQQRLWFLSQFEGVSEAYHISGGLRLHGVLDTSALQRALDRIVARHASLRTTFALVDGQAVQQIAAEDSGFQLMHHDLRDAPDREAALERRLTEAAQKPFALAQGPLIRGELMQLAETEHVLFVSMHHIVSDGWSMSILIDELSVLYRSFACNEADPLTPLPIQYADYALWQRQWLAGDVLQQQATYWRQALSGAPALLELPSDHPRPARQTYAGAQLDVLVDAEQVQALKALSQRHGMTLYMTLLASWAMLLSRLSGQGDVVIGSPAANRGRSETEGLIGFFVNTLALRIDLSGAPTLGQLLASVKTSALQAQAHQDIPFEQVVELVQPPRSLAHAPLFQVMFSWQNTPQGTLDLDELEVSKLSVAQTSAKFDLSLSLEESEDGIVGNLTYATALFERATLERWLGHWRHLLDAMVSEGAEDRAVDRLSWLGEADRNQLLMEWNATAADYPRDACVHALFEAQVARDPLATAVVYGDVALSYGALNARANQLAYRLRALGVGLDDRVAICVQRSVEMVVAVLAVLKAGGAYVPLDPDYPQERLAYMLADCGAMMALTDTASRWRVEDTHAALVIVDLQADAEAWQHLPDRNPDRHASDVTARHLAYVIYTSGSTGTPKGVMIEHAGLTNYLSWAVRFYRPDTGALVSSSLAFDATITSLYVPLLCGARIELVPEQDKLEALHQRLCSNASPGLVKLTPAHLATLGQQLAAQPGAKPSATLFVIGGEALLTSTVTLWHERAPGMRLVNEYGPTETVVGCVAQDVSGPYRLDAYSQVPIGRPIGNMRIYILDVHSEPVPVGVVGQLHIAGVQMARGYRDRPALTAERFIADPFSGTPGARMYRSGDLGRWRADGTIEFVKRNDHQVKIRGFRIELGEIEARLGAHAAVRECVVVALEDAAGSGKRLVAYWVGAEGATSDGVDAEALRGWLAATLPEYMVPAAYVALEALPLTPNGKLDRKALPAPDGAAYATTAYEAPQGAIEEAITAIWCDLLGLDTIGRHDNFFTLGGHSLLAVTLTERMRRQGLQADLRTLFATPTLAALAAAIGSVSVRVPPNGITPDSAAIRPQMLPLVALTQAQIDAIVAMTPGGVANVQDIYPLAPLQEGIFFHHLLQREGDAYLLPHLIAFDSRARLDGFVAALQRVIDRHDILRTAVVWEGLVEPVQVVWRHAPLLIEEVQLEDADGDAATQLQSRFDPQHWRMDVRQAPLMRGFAAHDPASGQWLLSLLCHHLALDHTTLEIALEEVNSHLRGDADRLPAPQPFRHFVAQALLGVSRAEHEAYFRTLLGDVEEPCAPFGLLDVQGDGSTVEEAQRVLPEQLSALLRRQARTLGVSVASLFHLAWAQVVARATGRASAVFGTVLFGRMQGGAGADRTLGLFINTLPLRIEVDGTGVVDSVRVVQQRLAALLRHEHAPLSLAQQCSGVAAPAPLFTSLLNYRHSVEATDAVGSGSWEGIQTLSAQERTNYPLTVSVDDWGPGFTLKVHSQHPLVPARIVAFLEKALEELAEALAHAPETAVNALDVLPQAERDQVLRQWNATAADYPRDACVHELFEAQVARDPSAIAVTQAEVSLTYRELNARANRLAHYLRGLGVGPDDRVAICLERSVEMVVAVLAVLKAGGAYVPLDPHYPPERLSHMLADSGAVAVLTDMASRHLVEHRADAAVIVDLSANGERWAHGPDSNPDRHACGLTAHHLAYVIYTSGSTGAPKGAMNEHRAVVNRVMWMQEAYALEHSEVVLQKTPLSFDVSVWEVFWPLLSGACVQLAAPQGHKDPAYLKALMREGKITTLHFVPSMLRALVEHGDDARFPAIQRVICSGEALSPVLGARAQAMFPAAGIFNLYGPTEAAVDVTAWRYRADEAQETAASLPIGRPIANTQIYLLDAHGAPVPIGVMGEIHIGGDGVGRGYLNRDALTAERFLADPFSDIPDARMYRTGDLGRWRADGTIDFIGRNDHQVKIRGFRIELGEIEARLSAHDAVRACVVVALDDAASTDKRLVAYWVAAEGLASDGVCADSVDAQRLRDWLAATLPDYMVPAAYVQLEALPLTANGKLDRRALPAPDAGALVVQAYAAPQGELEIGLAALWRELLGVEQVGRHDSFFALGGHSLLGVRLISRIRSELGLELPLAALFAQPRLAELALALGDAGTTALPPILPVPRTEPMRLSFAQQRLWFLNQLDPRTGATYIMHGGVHLSGNLHVRALTRALDRIVARHETLRTHFANGEETPLQIIDAPRAVALQLIDLSGEPAPQSAARLHANNEANTGFDLANGPLFRGRLLRLAEREHVLLLSMHHIVSDGWSIGVLIEELGTLYAAFVQDQPDPLPPLPIQYADYAAWQHRWIDSQLQQRQLDFWCAQLRDAPALLELPTDRPRPPLQDTASDHVQVLLDETLSVRLQALAVQHGISIFGLLLAGWAALLSRYSGQTDLVIGTASAGRNRSELEPLIGFFVNTLPLRIDLSARPTFLELLDQVQATLLAAQANQDLPFERIIEAVRPVRSLSHTPLCQTMFSSDTTPARALELPDLQLSAYPSDHHVAQFDLSLDMQIAPTRIGGVLHYATALFERSTMQAYLDNYARLLAALADAPTLAVDRQVLLDADGWRSLQRWNDTARAVAPPTTIHTAFQAQARSTPDAMAVIDGDRTLRYAELDALSNHIALQLIAAGVRSGECVVTLLPRSADLVAAQLGILKAGATYVPLDPRQPAARHAQLAEDCQARAIVHAPGDAPSWATAPCLDIASTARPTDAFVAPPLPAAAPAYVMYTSGSSGKPKGVLVPHQAVLNLVRAPDYARWQADDRFAFASNPAFDSSTLEVWAPLLSGGSVVVVPQDVLLDPGLLADFARTHAISVLILVAGVLRAYASELARTLPTLRYLITGGDIADPQALATLLRGHRPHTLLQTYGPTETTQFVTAIGVSEVPEAGQRIPIGKPIGNLRLYVLDAHRQALPVGMQGELHIAGLGLAMGYLRQPGLTAEQFVPDPFSTVPGARMYRTGDLGRWRADGQLECLGRRDAQSKIRGFRLESGEIEAALRTHPQVDQALVRVCEDITGQRRLVAYVIGTQIDDSAAHDPNALRSHLADTLPDYMLPDAYVLMQTWPLTANGKLDARALPAPDDAQRGIAGIAPPQGETECALAEIWCALLGISTVNRHDNFFDIGGHSLLAVQLATRIQARLGRRLPLSRLFAEPTLARMAAALADSRVASSAPIATLVNRSNYYE